MKIKVTIKDPDVLGDAITEAVEAEVKTMNLPKDEAELLIQARMNKHSEAMSKWWGHSEYLTVEFDMETMTAQVLARK